MIPLVDGGMPFILKEIESILPDIGDVAVPVGEIAFWILALVALLLYLRIELNATTNLWNGSDWIM